MAFGDSAAQKIADGLRDALGRELQDAEKSAASLAQGVVDHTLQGLKDLISSKRIVISFEDKT